MHREIASVVVVAMALAVGCGRDRATKESTREEVVAACAKAGDRCEFGPGKIGLCTAREGSTALTCVSLH